MPIFFFEENDDGTSHVARAVLLRETNLLRHMLEVHCHYFIALHSTSLHYTALHCTTLHYTVLHCTTQHFTALHCTTPHFIALHSTSLRSSALHYTSAIAALYCTKLFYTALTPHYTIFHCIILQLYVLYCTTLHYTALCTNTSKHRVMQCVWTAVTAYVHSFLHLLDKLIDIFY